MDNFDIIILGSGIAACQLAAHLSTELNVIMITKGKRSNSNSYMAQGGIAAAISGEDSWEQHFNDTIEAGERFHNETEVMKLVQEASGVIKELEKAGVRFDKNKNGEFLLGQEGAHSRKRILHCGGDATGRFIMNQLTAGIPENIPIVEGEFVYELIIHPVLKKCIGVKTKDDKGKNHVYYGAHIVLAVGGIGGLFPFTSNDYTVAGDGLALAYKAGAEIMDAEFIQFHPTLLYTGGKTRGLVSEAVRGEGGILVNDRGKAIMHGLHPLKDLAPRHIVAEQIFKERLAGREVFLDIQSIEKFAEKFPTIAGICKQYGVSIKDGRIPVAPGCHFFMGGVKIDSNGRTNVEGLYAIGEAACSGVHGANRLASNSLLEGLVFGKRLAGCLNGCKSEKLLSEIRPFYDTGRRDVDLPDQLEIRERMMENAGIIRERKKLESFLVWLERYCVPELLQENADEITIEQIQTTFMLTNAWFIAKSSLMREESRGGHIRADFPDADSKWKDHHIIHSINGVEKRRRQDEFNQIEIHA